MKTTTQRIAELTKTNERIQMEMRFNVAQGMELAQLLATNEREIRNLKARLAQEEDAAIYDAYGIL